MIGGQHMYRVTADRMLLRKWNKTKQQPSRAMSGHQISCCLVSLHFLSDILPTILVMNFIFLLLFLGNKNCYLIIPSMISANVERAIAQEDMNI